MPKKEKKVKMKLLSAQIPLWNRKVKKLIPIQSVSAVQFSSFSFYLHVESLAVDSPRLQKSNHICERERRKRESERELLVRESIDIDTRVDIVP